VTSDDDWEVLRPGGTLTPMWDLLDDADPLSRTLSELAMHDGAAPGCSTRTHHRRS
jgi:hypothetical protein